MRIDLQMHSTYSDGYFTPTELATYAKKKNIQVASLTDHNTVGGIYEFKKACKEIGIKAITGMELYVKMGSARFNILWYNLDETDSRLHALLRDSQKRRRAMMRRVLERMKKQGFDIDPNKILDKYNHYVPINRVIDDIVTIPANYKLIQNKLKLESFREEDVIYHFFQNPKIKPVLRNSFIDINRVFELRKKIGGQIILCHPAKQSYIRAKQWEKLKKIGLDGAELLSPHHSYGSVVYIQHLSRELDLIETGGSDFHRVEGNSYPIQRSWDYFHIHSRFLRRIDEIIGK